jgi:hypothetical protein
LDRRPELVKALEANKALLPATAKKEEAAN